MRKQLARTHETEKGSKPQDARDDAAPRPLKKGPLNRFKPWHLNRPRAHQAQVSDSEEDDDREPEESSDVAERYVCQSCGPDSDSTSIEDRIEQDIVAAYAAAGQDVSEPAIAEEAGVAVRDETHAFYSRQDAHKRGVEVERKLHNLNPRSEFSLKGRQEKAKLAK